MMALAAMLREGLHFLLALILHILATLCVGAAFLFGFYCGMWWSFGWWMQWAKG